MGPNTPSNHTHLARTYHNTMKHDTGDLWLKVQEKETGKVVGARNWKGYVGCVPEHREELGWEWLRGEGQEVELARAREVVQGILETRRRLFVEPYVRAYILLLSSMSIPFGKLTIIDQNFTSASWTQHTNAEASAQ